MPIGPVIQQNLRFDSNSFEARINGLMEEKFTGYVIITLEGYKGVEEGVLVFKKGEVIGSAYEYMNLNALVLGNFALPQVFNCAAAKNNTADLVALSAPHIDLILAFNEKIQLTKPFSKKNVKELRVESYSNKYAEKILQELSKETTDKTGLLKKFGLTEIDG